MANLQPYKVPTFPGINDTPVVPTANKGGNGSDLIKRHNDLCDMVQNTFNNDPNIAIPQWQVGIPDSTDIAKIRVYFLNCTEHKILNDNPLNLYLDDLIATYEVDTGFTPNTNLDITNLVLQNGIGYYFVVFQRIDNTFKGRSGFYPMDSNPKGAVKRLDTGKTLDAYYEELYSGIALDVMPIAVTQTNATVSIPLTDIVPE
jgi:hypothetical protein